MRHFDEVVAKSGNVLCLLNQVLRFSGFTAAAQSIAASFLRQLLQERGRLAAGYAQKHNTSRVKAG
ncbi:hypothetical protein CJU72_16660 [Pseudomonas fragi]|nr:hypothetical protein CJU72_16660 [Pseudomonas fragi]